VRWDEAGLPWLIAPVMPTGLEMLCPAVVPASRENQSGPATTLHQAHLLKVQPDRTLLQLQARPTTRAASSHQSIDKSRRKSTGFVIDL
jgi:hypothetical protein